MSEPYGLLLENPRRGRGGRFVKSRSRKRRSRRRRASSRRRRRSRRRRNPAIMGSNPRRRRRSRRRRASSRRRRYGRRRSYRRNPFGFMKGGRIGSTLMAGLGIAGSELAGDLLSRVAVKAGASKLLGAVRVPAAQQVPVLRVLVGLFASPLLRMLRVPPAITRNFGAVNVASGILTMSANLRQQALARVGLGDYELADVLVGDDEVGDVLVDFELADFELAGDYSDQSYYGTLPGYGGRG